MNCYNLDKNQNLESDCLPHHIYVSDFKKQANKSSIKIYNTWLRLNPTSLLFIKIHLKNKTTMDCYLRSPQIIGT